MLNKNRNNKVTAEKNPRRFNPFFSIEEGINILVCLLSDIWMASKLYSNHYTVLSLENFKKNQTDFIKHWKLF